VTRSKFFLGVFLVLLANVTLAQNPITPPPIVLAPGDTAAFAHAPEGFNIPKENIPHGKTDTIEYFSTSVGNKRHMLVYTPPGYSVHKKYPVLFLLHGIGGDEKEWYKYTKPDAILDNLYAQHKIVAMIVVFPNGRAQPDDRPIGNIYAAAPAFEMFGKDLLTDIIPFMEANYPLKKGAKNRAIAGYSMGGGQALNIGLTNLDTFAWIGGFSSAPDTKAPATLIPNPIETAKKIKLLYLSCGNKDGLIFISQRMHNYLLQNNIPHIWQVDTGGHNMTVWENDLYLFSQRIFK
jgi:enterochelin esterase-like enzyme